jgi:hypothetical protein
MPPKTWEALKKGSTVSITEKTRALAVPLRPEPVAPHASKDSTGKCFRPSAIAYASRPKRTPLATRKFASNAQGSASVFGSARRTKSPGSPTNASDAIGCGQSSGGSVTTRRPCFRRSISSESLVVSCKQSLAFYKSPKQSIVRHRLSEPL